jgi:hypothetical protein
MTADFSFNPLVNLSHSSCGTPHEGNRDRKVCTRYRHASRHLRNFKRADSTDQRPQALRTWTTLLNNAGHLFGGVR